MKLHELFALGMVIVVSSAVAVYAQQPSCGGYSDTCDTWDEEDGRSYCCLSNGNDGYFEDPEGEENSYRGTGALCGVEYRMDPGLGCVDMSETDCSNEIPTDSCE